MDKKETDVFPAGADIIRREKYFAQKTAPASQIGPKRAFFRLEAQNVRRPIFTLEFPVYFFHLRVGNKKNLKREVFFRPASATSERAIPLFQFPSRIFYFD